MEIEIDGRETRNGKKNTVKPNELVLCQKSNKFIKKEKEKSPISATCANQGK